MDGITNKTGPMGKVTAIIVAAGEGIRFGGEKQAAALGGKAVLEWSLSAFERSPEVSEIILVLKRDRFARQDLSRFGKISQVAPGGRERQDSVSSGLSLVDPARTEIVLVHDGVRPLVSEEMIHRVILGARRFGAAVPVIPLEDTIKRGDGEWVIGTEDRTNLYRTQTPQGFQYDILMGALKAAEGAGRYATDEASLVEQAGGRVALVEGDPRNIKITSPGDLKIAEALIET